MAQSLHVFFVQWGRGSANNRAKKVVGVLSKNCVIFESTSTLTFWPKRSAIWVGVLSSEYGIYNVIVLVFNNYTSFVLSDHDKYWICIDKTLHNI